QQGTPPFSCGSSAPSRGNSRPRSMIQTVRTTDLFPEGASIGPIHNVLRSVCRLYGIRHWCHLHHLTERDGQFFLRIDGKAERSKKPRLALAVWMHGVKQVLRDLPLGDLRRLHVREDHCSSPGSAADFATARARPAGGLYSPSA